MSVHVAGIHSALELSCREAQDHDDMSDDTVSVAESSKATRKRKSENERKEWFLGDKDCETSEPHRVKCARCKNWIDLHPKRKYVMKFWLAHKKACDSPDLQVYAFPPFVDPSIN